MSQIRICVNVARYARLDYNFDNISVGIFLLWNAHFNPLFNVVSAMYYLQK